jgi:hypothetical protein
MLKPGVVCTGINQVRHAQLLDMPQSLKVGVRYNIEDQLAFDADETVNRIVNDLLFIQGKQLRA